MSGNSLDALGKILRTTIFGRTGIEYHPALPSTNLRGRELGRSGAPEGMLIVADEQTAGRGRLGRAWASPPGVNLYFSLILRPDLPLDRIPSISLAAALGAAEAISSEAGLAVEIKWPNDLLLNGRKICGILAEIDHQPDAGRFVVLGLGLNVNLKIEDLPEESIRRGAGSLASAAGREFDRVLLLSRLLTELEREYLSFFRGGIEDIVRRYRSRCVTVGARVNYSTGGGIGAGQATDIDGLGRLVVRPDEDGEPVHLDAGEVTITGAGGQSSGKMS